MYYCFTVLFSHMFYYSCCQTVLHHIFHAYVLCCTIPHHCTCTIRTCWDIFHSSLLFSFSFLLGYSHVSHTMLTYQTWRLGLWRKMPYGRCISTNEGHVMKSLQNDDNIVTKRGQEEAFCHAPTLVIWNILLNSSMVIQVFLFQNI